MNGSTVRFEVRGSDSADQTRRLNLCKEIARRVVGSILSFQHTVVCLIDDQDYGHLRQRIGVANRGLFSPVRGQGLRDLIPQYFWDSVIAHNYKTWRLEELYDCLIYVHGTTASSDVGLAFTLAHELQHFVQYSKYRSVWVIHRLLVELATSNPQTFKRWADFPIEREARIVSKRVATEMFSADLVRLHIQGKIVEHANDADVEDWEYLLSVEPGVEYDVVEGTRRLVHNFRDELISMQTQDWSDCPEVADLDLIAPEWQ